MTHARAAAALPCVSTIPSASCAAMSLEPTIVTMLAGIDISAKPKLWNVGIVGYRKEHKKASGD